MIRGARRSFGRLDKAEGLVASGSMLCLAHCLALPLLLYLLPTAVGLVLGANWFHAMAVGLVVPTALAMFLLGYRRHARLLPLIVGGIGAACLIGALLVGLAHPLDDYLMAAGSVVLILGHGINWRFRVR